MRRYIGRDVLQFGKIRLTLRPVRAALSALALAFALPACAQQPGKAPPPRAANDADPALWVVKGKRATIYLFGTIHVLKPGLTWFDEAVKTAFDRSDQVALEIVMPEPAVMQGLVQTKGMNPGGPPLTDQIPAGPKRDAYVKAVTDLGLPANAFDAMKPWLAATSLSILPLGKLGYDARNGPEKVIADAAKAAHKPVIGLETAEQQLGYFGSLSQAAQIQFLDSTVDELPKLPETMAKMVDAWSAGKPDVLAAEMNDSLKDSPEVAKVLLVDRNTRWASWIANRMQSPGTVFIAVGAGHLAGPDSVQAKLAKLGVRANRVAY